MLLSNEKNQEPAATIGAGVAVKGVMKVPGLVVVEGSFDGELTAETVVVGNSGQVTGTVSATLVEVMGRIRHQLTAQHLVIHATGSVSGEASYSVLEVARGGEIDGKINRLPATASTPDNAAAWPAAFQ